MYICICRDRRREKTNGSIHKMCSQLMVAALADSAKKLAAKIQRYAVTDTKNT